MNWPLLYEGQFKKTPKIVHKGQMGQKGGGQFRSPTKIRRVAKFRNPCKITRILQGFFFYSSTALLLLPFDLQF